MNGRLRAYLATFILMGLVASPLAGAFSGDSFPISTYPMFASVPSTETRLSHAILIGVDGKEWPAPPSAIANNEALQAQETIRQALRQGDAATAALCERIARREAGMGATQVLIVTSTYDAILFYEGQREPVTRNVEATCEVRP